MGRLGPGELAVVVAVVFLLFGAKRMPDAARSVGESLKIFKKAVREDQPPAPPVEQRQVTGVPDPTPPSTRADNPARTDQ